MITDCSLFFCQFGNDVVREIKRLWPGTVLVTGKPQHSESNGGVKRRNRCDEEKLHTGYMKQFNAMGNVSPIHPVAM